MTTLNLNPVVKALFALRLTFAVCFTVLSFYGASLQLLTGLPGSVWVSALATNNGAGAASLLGLLVVDFLTWEA